MISLKGCENLAWHQKVDLAINKIVIFYLGYLGPVSQVHGKKVMWPKQVYEIIYDLKPLTASAYTLLSQLVVALAFSWLLHLPWS
jgi:hypothetical protein